MDSLVVGRTEGARNRCIGVRLDWTDYSSIKVIRERRKVGSRSANDNGVPVVGFAPPKGATTRASPGSNAESLQSASSPIILNVQAQS